MKRSLKIVPLILLTVFMNLSSPCFADVPSYNAECYNSANIGTVGDLSWNGCSGKLIADKDLLLAVIASNDSYSAQGDTWNVSEVFTGQITNFSFILSGNTTISGTSDATWNISGWDVSNGTNFDYAFDNASNFNQPLNGWDMSSATRMEGIFENATSFNQPLDRWNLSNVYAMDFSFYNAASFYQDVSSWCTSSLSYTPFLVFGATSMPASYIPTWQTCSESCADGVQNGDEEGIDCGGSCSIACATCSDGLWNQDETGLDCGGSCGACAAAEGESVCGFPCPAAGHIHLFCEDM